MRPGCASGPGVGWNGVVSRGKVQNCVCLSEVGVGQRNYEVLDTWIWGTLRQGNEETAGEVWAARPVP